jgi:ABC-type multidrug transport system fused ATPase/permease subunit
MVIFVSSVFAFGNSLSVVQIFRVLAFVNVLRLPTNLLGQALKTYNDALVSVVRLNRFFLLPTLPEHTIIDEGGPSLGVAGGEDRGGGGRIVVSSATFSWEGSARLASMKKQPTNASGNISAAAGAAADNKSNAPNTKLPNNSNNTAFVAAAAAAKEEGGAQKIDASSSATISGFSLKNINISSNSSDELIAVIGAVGSGKCSKRFTLCCVDCTSYVLKVSLAASYCTLLYRV